jgi:hypothetical protein
VTDGDIHDGLKRIMVLLAPDDLSSDFPDPKRAAEAKKAIVGLLRKIDHRIVAKPRSIIGYYADREAAMAEADRLFESYWRPLVCDEDGTLDVEKVKKELYDYRELRDDVEKVYGHITGIHTFGGREWTTDVAKVIEAADRHLKSCVDAAVKEATGH